MYILLPNEPVQDAELEQLLELLALLDRQRDRYDCQRRVTQPPEQNIFWDRISYIAGLGFVMCQQYVTTTCQIPSVEKADALRLPPMHESGHSVVEIINAAANHWKHYLEDVDHPKGTLRKSTISPILALGLGLEECCLQETILEALAETTMQPFEKIGALITKWRDNLILKDQQTSSAVPRTSGGTAALAT